MNTRAQLPNKLVGENIAVVFDFTGQLAVNETISTKVCTVAVYSGTDAAPSTLLDGAATSSGSRVTQSLIAGTLGVIYELTCTITTSLSQTLQQCGYVAVVPKVP